MPSLGIRYAARSVPEPDSSERFVDRLSRQGEEALGRLAEELLANPVVNSALTRTLEAREKAVQAQEAALGALNIPSTALRSGSPAWQGPLPGIGARRATSAWTRSSATWLRCARRWRRRPSRCPGRRSG